MMLLPRPAILTLGLLLSSAALAADPNDLTLRYTRMLFTQDLKRAFLDELGHGLAREAYAQRQFFPVGGGMAPLDRPWDEQPWSD